MDRDGLKKYFDVLELEINASINEIRNAYMLLKEVYGDPESIVTGPLADEMEDENHQDILDRLEEAYTRLIAAFDQDRGEPKRQLEKVLTDIDTYDGPALKKIRRRLKVDLNDMALATRIQVQHLINIEEENFTALPVRVYTRGFVANYARHLHLDEERVVSDYMTGFCRHEKDNNDDS